MRRGPSIDVCVLSRLESGGALGGVGTEEEAEARECIGASDGDPTALRRRCRSATMWTMGDQGRTTEQGVRAGLALCGS